MLGRAGLVLALVSLTVLVGVRAVPAAAEGEPETGAFNSFSLKASNGYTMTVLGFSEDNYEKGEVWVYLGHGNTAVLYQVPAKVTATKAVLTGSRFNAGLVHARWYEESPEIRRPSLLP